jgi:uncharacterized protein
VTALIDTGPLVATVDRSDKYHQACLEVFAERSGDLLLPSTVLIETCWVISSRLGADAMAKLLGGVSEDLTAGNYSLVELTKPDVARMSELARTYGDLRLDATDASVIAIAERLRITDIATLDRRDFSVVRPSHASSGFNLLPRSL